MKRLGLVLVAMTLACNSGDDGDTDSSNNSGSGGSSTGVDTESTMTATESETANTESASGGSSSTTDDSTTTGGGESSSGDTTGSGSDTDASTSTGGSDDQSLCEGSGGTWDDTACGHYVCGVPNDCEAIIPGCDCGEDSNFVDGEGCVADDTCATFACGDEVECIVALEYCVQTFPGQKGAPITYECNDMPKACADSVDCDCLTSQIMLPPPGDCSEPVEDGLSVTVFLP